MIFKKLMGYGLLVGFGGIFIVGGWFGSLWSRYHDKDYVDKSQDITSNIVSKKNISAIPLVVIGSGPAGLSAAIYGARSAVKTVVFEGDIPGGQLTRTTAVENWPGRSIITGNEIIENLRNQAVSLGAELRYESIDSVDFSQWPYTLTLNDEQVITALTVIIATGATPRVLNIPGEREYWGQGVTTCAICDAPFYKNREVIVVGGGDAAVEEALQLSAYAKKITLIVRAQTMRALASGQERIKNNPKISCIYTTQVTEIYGDDSGVTGVRLLNNTTGEIVDFPTDGVFLAIGHTPNTDLFSRYIACDEHGYITMSDRTQKTSLPGVFAAGDVEDSRYRQAGVAAGRGICAALDAVAFLAELK